MQRRKPNGSRVRDLRESRGWSQEELAGVAGVGVRTVQRLERGTGASLESLKAVASAFDVDMATLLCEPRSNTTPKIHILRRMRSGDQLCDILAHAHLFQNQYPEPSSEAERDEIARFLQDAHDVGESWDEIGPARCVELAYDLGQSMRELESVGFRIFAGRVVNTYRFAIDPAVPVTMTAAIVVIVRDEECRILGADTEHERIAFAIQADAAA